MGVYNKSLLCTNNWPLEDIMKLLNAAIEMKQNRFGNQWSECFKNRSFLMLFYSPSLRTNLSFVAAASELGGHAHYLEPKMARFNTEIHHGEIIEGIANVMSCYMSGVGIRIMESAVKEYGSGHDFIKQYEKHLNIPVINMADDKFHPCQGLADMLTWQENFSKKNACVFDETALKGKNVLLTWGRGGLARSWNSPQETLLLASRFGMNITLARPDGYDLDSDVYKLVTQNCIENNNSFNIIDNPNEGYEGADIVYSRNWLSSNAYVGHTFNKEMEITKALSSNFSDWSVTTSKMLRTNNALFSHPMPVDRGYEVSNDVLNNGNSSIIYEIAANRLHVQKAIIALTMGIKPEN